MLHQTRTDMLEPWDFTVLEMMRPEDMTALMNVGTMRFTRSIFRLYTQGLIVKLDRKSTFDKGNNVMHS